MFVNVKLTKVCQLVLCTLFVLTAFAIFSIPAFAFSEDCAVTAAENTMNVEPVVSDGPVDVVLVKNGAEYEYSYFPVECSEFLSYTGITLTEVDKLSVPTDTILYDNMMIDISTVEYKHYTVEEPAPYGYDLIEVDTIPKGEMKVLTEGTDGVKKVSYIEKTVDGMVTEKEIIAEEIITQPINGTAEYGVGGTITASDGTVYTYSYKKYMEATAYTYVPGLTTMTTATGATLAKGIVAVDPDVIPLHTEMYIASDTFEYGYGVAGDTGGAIKGDIVDLAFMSYDECIQFGRRNIWVYILD